MSETYIYTIVSIICGIQMFMLYKLYSISVKLAKIEERIEWLIKMVNSS